MVTDSYVTVGEQFRLILLSIFVVHARSVYYYTAGSQLSSLKMGVFTFYAKKADDCSVVNIGKELVYNMSSRKIDLAEDRACIVFRTTTFVNKCWFSKL